MKYESYRFLHDSFEFRHSESSELLSKLSDVLDKVNELGWAMSDLAIFLTAKNFTELDVENVNRTYKELRGVLDNLRENAVQKDSKGTK